MNEYDPRSAAVREVAARAVRRLNVLEYVVLAIAAALALVAGAIVAFLLAEVTGMPFRPMWIVSSLVLFIVPAAGAAIRNRREEARLRERLRALDTGAGRGEREERTGDGR